MIVKFLRILNTSFSEWRNYALCSIIIDAINCEHVDNMVQSWSVFSNMIYAYGRLFSTVKMIYV